MPELPEVEVIKRGLRRTLEGRRISTVEVLEPRSFRNFTQQTREQLLGAAVCGLQRRGKLLIIELNNGLVLTVHLRMTGQLVFRAARTVASHGNLSCIAKNSGKSNGADPCRKVSMRQEAKAPSADIARVADKRGGKGAMDPAAQTSLQQEVGRPQTDFGGGAPGPALVGELPDRTTRVVVGFADGSHLYFNDQRKFGYMQLLPAGELGQDAFVARLGPDPTSPDFTWKDLKRRLPAGSQRSIKAALLDQGVLAGIGNIYADESLHRACVNPATPVAELSIVQIKRLYAALRECLRLSIDSGGSTSRNYVNAEGLRGEFLDLHAQVYNRAGQPCPRCGTPIVKRKVAGRGTHLCPRCQK